MGNLYMYVSIFLMAAVTYLIRFIPLWILRKPIKNKFFRSFLYYSPYVTLSVMTFPAVLSCTGDVRTSLIGFAAALIMSFSGLHFVITTFGSCFAVFIFQLFLH